MLVFTDVNPTFQQVDIHSLSDSPAMKLFGPPNLESILFQELYFQGGQSRRRRDTQPVTQILPHRQDTTRNTKVPAFIHINYTDRFCMQYTVDPSYVRSALFIKVARTSDDAGNEVA